MRTVFFIATVIIGVYISIGAGSIALGLAGCFFSILLVYSISSATDEIVSAIKESKTPVVNPPSEE